MSFKWKLEPQTCSGLYNEYWNLKIFLKSLRVSLPFTFLNQLQQSSSPRCCVQQLYLIFPLLLGFIISALISTFSPLNLVNNLLIWVPICTQRTSSRKYILSALIFLWQFQIAYTFDKEAFKLSQKIYSKILLFAFFFFFFF